MENREQRLTASGVAKYEERLEYLKTVRRLEIAEQIKVARAFGDISENAEYDEAKNEQARIEREIMNIENMLRVAVVIDEDSIDTHIVSIGGTIRVLDVEYDEELEYTIVGPAEADPEENKLSNESPVGRALLGHTIGDTVDVSTPGGVLSFRIIDIHK